MNIVYVLQCSIYEFYLSSPYLYGIVLLRLFLVRSNYVKTKIISTIYYTLKKYSKKLVAEL